MILKVLGAALLCMPLMAGVCRAAEESVTPQGQASENKEDTTPGTSPVAETGKLPPLAAMITSLHSSPHFFRILSFPFSKR